jgi:hypothetical protein
MIAARSGTVKRDFPAADIKRQQKRCRTAR